ncbi:MAG: beta-phosphoglucomutase family hydrolase [Myxococcota bacterium]
MVDRAPSAAPDIEVAAVIFDLDGVVTRTASLHAAAWKDLFDELLRARVAEGHAPFVPFDSEADYLRWVDGRPRHEGVRRFLAARGIEVREGTAGDGPGLTTVHALAARKDALFKQMLRRDGVGLFQSTIAFIRSLRRRGMGTAVVTSSRNGREVLRVAGIEGLFDVRVDGIDAEALSLAGKPHPDPFLRAAALLGVAPWRAVVVEDATSGVEAGRRGGFGLVVGVDRGGNREALESHGADVVVGDLDEIDLAALGRAMRSRREAVLAWNVEQEGFDPAREHGMESLFTVGNGYLGVRGALDTPLPGAHAELFIAGVYDRKSPDRPYSEVEFIGDDRADSAESELVSAPLPFRIALAVDGVELAPTRPCCRTHRRTLDLRRGILRGYAEYDTDADRRVVVRTLRCASLSDVHLLLQEVQVSFVNHSGTVALDTSLEVPDLAADHPHLTPLDSPRPDATLDVRRYVTQASRIEICIVSRALFEGADAGGVGWTTAGLIGRTLTWRRFVAVYTSRDVADPLAAAMRRVEGLGWKDFDEQMAAHAQRWQDVWVRADVRVEGSPATEQALRFNAYHLISAAGRDPRVSVGARALTGRAYEGHVFWDAEIFKLPFYLHTFPDLARSMLLYRHNTLDGARRRARELGYRGACFAWESTTTGDDVTPRMIRLRSTGHEIPIFTGIQQVHVTAGVAHAVWRYWEATQDRAFMSDAGVEILAETARFWASRCVRGARRFHIREVVGPDEYHHGVTDNAYTNWMARFNLERAVAALEWLREESPGDWRALCHRIAVSGVEIDEWREVARDLHCPGPNDHGVIEQFEGFFELEDYALPREERFKAPISRLFDWERINRTKLVKQADVLMLLHLFPDAFPLEVVAANYRYYEPLTDHASSLSPGIHAAVAARIGLREDAERYWRESLWLDLTDRMGNSAHGIHPACMGATWQALVFGFLGVRHTEAGPICDPAAGARIPGSWAGVEVGLTWRGRSHALRIAREGAP